MATARNPRIWRATLLAITVCLLSLPAHAKYSGGMGEPNDPYQIATAEDLMLLGETPADYDKHFILTADIDLDPNLPGRKVFDRAVIAPDTDPTDQYGFFQGTAFTGVFDGSGHTISHLTIKGAGYLGLFGRLASGAEVRNLGVVDVNITGSGDKIGGLVGQMVDTCHVTCCYSNGAVSGGLYVGGLVGLNAYSAGDHWHEGGTISECYSIAGTSGDGALGGLVGLNTGTVTNCYSAGTVGGAGWGFGGLVGNGSPGDVTASFWDIQTSGQTTSSGGMPKTTAEMQTTRTFLRWGTCGDEGTWTIDEGNDYPRLAWERKPGIVLDFRLSDFLEGSGTEDDPYLIYTAYDIETIASFPCEQDKCFRLAFLKGMGTENDPYLIYTVDEINLINMCANYVADARFRLMFVEGRGTQENPYLLATAEQFNMIGMLQWEWDKHYKLLADIDMSAFDGKDGRSAFKGIGTFTGVFDGDGHTILHLTISGGSYLGLFGQLDSASVSNLFLQAVDISGGGYVGGLVGKNHYGVVTSCYITGTVRGAQYVGGLVGHNDGGSIATSCSSVLVSGTWYSVGGLVGCNVGSITACYSTGAVSGGGSEKVSSGVGGLAGYNGGSITTCWSSGEVRGTTSDVGGLVGAGAGSVLYSVWDMEISGLLGSAGGVGLTTAEMMDPYMLGLNGFANNPNWVLDDGRDYPRLAWEGTAGQMISESDIDWWAGQGTAEVPYRIDTADQLILLGKASILWNRYFVLAADIDLDPAISGRWIFGQAVIPAFSGVFDGSGHSVRRLTITGHSKLGLFGRLESVAKVKNLALVDVNILGSGSYIGGLVGYNSRGTITNCSSSGMVTGMYDGEWVADVGGLVGESSGTLAQCYSTVVTSGNGGVGGLVGVNHYYGTVTQCYSNGTVSADQTVGGLVGSNGGTVTQCYSAGAVGGDRNVGGMVGYRFERGNATQCFWDIQTSGQSTSAGGTGKDHSRDADSRHVP